MTNIYWHAVSEGGLPAIMGEDPEEDLELLRAGGFTASAEQKELQRRREAEIPADKSFDRLTDEQLQAYKRHFGSYAKPKKYAGDVPGEIARKFAEFKAAEEPLFESIELWIADDGEVLAIGNVSVEGDQRNYLIVQWGFKGERTTLEDITGQSVVALNQLNRKRVQAYLLAVVCYLVGLSWCMVGLYDAFTGKDPLIPLLLSAFLMIFAGPRAVKRAANLK